MLAVALELLEVLTLESLFVVSDPAVLCGIYHFSRSN